MREFRNGLPLLRIDPHDVRSLRQARFVLPGGVNWSPYAVSNATPVSAPATAVAPAAARPLAWPAALIEAALLGCLMLSACAFAILLEHPASPVRRSVDSALARRALMGLAMGATAVALVYSRWGRRSGAHMNPAVTLSFLRLGRASRRDAALYVISQFCGAAGGAMVARLRLSPLLSAVNYVATVPGPRGPWVAWLAEFAIAFVLMSTVLAANGVPRLMRFTGVLAGLLVALYITFESPLSGTSMNPARTFGSAVSAGTWQSLWVYFTAPPLGMLAAVELRLRLARRPQHLCGKLTHSRTVRCVFECDCLERAATQARDRR